jgi:hypothetical protein
MVSSRQRAPHPGYGIFGLRFGARFAWTHHQASHPVSVGRRDRVQSARALQFVQNSCAEICFCASLPDMRRILNTFSVAEDIKIDSQCRSSVS